MLDQANTQNPVVTKAWEAIPTPPLDFTPGSAPTTPVLPLGPTTVPMDGVNLSALTAENVEMLQGEEVDPGQDGAEMLRSVFDSMAVRGRITMDQLPFVLVGAEVQATAKEIDDAIEEHLPDADDADAQLEFDQVLTLYQHLVRSGDAAQLEGPGAAEPGARGPAAWRRCWAWVRLRYRQRAAKHTAYEKHMKPTTRLLALILAISCAVSVAVVVLSAVFNFLQSDQLVSDHIRRDGQILADGLQLFGYTHPFQSYDAKVAKLTTLLAVVVQRLGYESTKRIVKASLVSQQQLLSNLLDGWYAQNSLDMANASVWVTRAWIEQLVAANATLGDIVDASNRINSLLPTGHEIILSRWNGTTGRMDFLTTFRYASACIGVCGADQVMGSTATRLALAGQSGAQFGYDYRPRPVISGYTPLQTLGLGLVYSLKQGSNRADFLGPAAAAIDALNAWARTRATVNDTDRRQNSQEIVLASQQGSLQVLTALANCNASCLAAAALNNTPVVAAVLGLNGTNETADFNGEPVICAYGPLLRSGLGMEVKLAQQEFLDNLFFGLGEALDVVNGMLPGTEEVQLASPRSAVDPADPGNGVQLYTSYRFPEDCGGPCDRQPDMSRFLSRSLSTCEAGVSDEPDYRGQVVKVGYTCLPAMGAALAFKVDHRQIIQEGTAMAGTIASYQNSVRFAGESTEVSVVVKRDGVAVARTPQDFNRITPVKYPWACSTPTTCLGPSTLILNAINGLTGYARTLDYRNVEVMGYFQYLSSLGIGMVVKMDAVQAEAGSFHLTALLCGCSVSAVFVGMALLALLANVLLRSMDRAWAEGKRAVEQEKQAFRAVIEAMYPAQVAQRMLAGESQIVYHVPSATVFFSDVYEFTTTSNSVTPQELIQFLGYTFGVMDVVAEHHHVHKVKTIGDAYLAVAGLPGLDSRTDSPALDMLLFASDCNQVFSNRFLHPAEGDILDATVRQMLTRKRQTIVAAVPEGPPRLSQSPTRPPALAYGVAVSAAVEGADDCGVPPVHCIMRYGLARGPLTAGVLQGKTPLFDIWGKTVNLASRMESTGQAGRIQVAEGVYQAVALCKDQPFLFESRHKVHCKGFGHVNAYFVDACAIAPPKELLERLHVEPNLGQFYFDNVVPDYKPAAKGGGPASGSGPASHGSSSTGNRHSPHSSAASLKQLRTAPHLG